MYLDYAVEFLAFLVYVFLEKLGECRCNKHPWGCGRLCVRQLSGYCGSVVVECQTVSREPGFCNISIHTLIKYNRFNIQLTFTLYSDKLATRHLSIATNATTVKRLYDA